MRFLGLGLADAVLDANTIWSFREALTRATIDGAAAMKVLFERFDAAVKASGYLAMGGQIIDATVAAPKQRNRRAETETIKQGRIPQECTARPAKPAQKDRDARWTVEYSQVKPRVDGMKMVDVAIPSFGYKNHIGIDRRHGLIRTWTVTDAAAHDGARLAGLLDRDNTASDVFADTAYRSKKNEAHLAKLGFVSRIHVKKAARAPNALGDAARQRPQRDMDAVRRWLEQASSGGSETAKRQLEAISS